MLKLFSTLIVWGGGALGLMYLASVAGIDIPSVVKQVDTVVGNQISLLEIKELSELTTSVGTFETVVDAYSTNELLGVTTGVNSLIYIVNASVRAGVDLSKADIENLEDGRILITLPAPQIQEITIHPERSRIWDERSDGFAPGDQAELLDVAQERSLDQLREAACNSDLLNQAKVQAERVVRNLAELNGTTVEIQFDNQNFEGCYESVGGN